MPRRILFISSNLPAPADPSGGAQRTALLMRAMKQWGEVDTVLVASPDYKIADTMGTQELRDRYGVLGRFRWPDVKPAGVMRYLRGLPGAGRMAMHSGAYRSDEAIARGVAEVAARGNYDVIVGRYLRPSLLAAIDKLDLPTIVDLDDLEWEVYRWLHDDKVTPSLKSRISGAITYRHHRALGVGAVNCVSHVFVASEEDQRALGVSHSSVVPNIPYAADPILPREPDDASLEVLFVGLLGYPANREGLDRFIGRVWPAVLAACPDARLKLVGGGILPESQRQWSAAPGVDIVGRVPALGDWYQRAAFSVAPIYWGGGTKIKVIESLAYNRTCVVTEHSFYGYSHWLKEGRDVLCGHTDEQMAQACVKLLTDPALRRQLAGRGREVADKAFSFDRFASAVLDALGRVTAKPTA